MSRRAFFVGIGGIGTSAIAQWLRASGWGVAGSDRARSDLTDLLVRSGIPVAVPEPSALPAGISVVVYSDAVPPTHVLRAAARARGVREISYAELLGELVAPFRTIAVAGSHGKSTTAALSGLILEAAGKDPTVVVGTRVPQWQEHGAGNFRIGKSALAVVEADEYREHFVNLRPDVAIVTSLDHDHVDAFPTKADYAAAFVRFLRRVPRGGLVVVSRADPAVLALRSHLPTTVRTLTFGVGDGGADSDVRVSEPILRDGRQEFQARVCGRDWGTFVLAAPGRHLVANAAAAIAATKDCGATPDDARRALAGFRGTWRRFEIVGHVKGAVVISDYAHHPTEVRALLAAARQWYPSRRLLMAFQPHQRARAHAFAAAFHAVLEDVEALILAEVYEVTGREEESPRVTTRDWVEELRRAGRPAEYAPTLERVEQAVRAQAREGDVILFVGAGTIDRVARRFAGAA